MTTSASESRAGGAQPPNRRSQLKSDRRLQLLSAAERLFAERGFLAVRLEDIGASAGVSGPAIYRHFPNKESLLVELLVGISTRLLAGARQVRARSADAAAALDGLIDFHLDFALNEPDLIRIQDRDLAYLPSGREAGAQGATAVRRGLGGRVARAEPRAGRGRCPADRARRVRPAQFDAAQHEVPGFRARQAGPRRPIARHHAGHDGRCAGGRKPVPVSPPS
ncbi:hypothetical protein D522_05888 [Mycobacterium avium subsp. paratuberculosis S5]|nr:hypothetical protein D522_05888 [Mycobacterium avium subsp. paratuberculosis S5]